jgi:feruloyl esterase
MGHCSGGEGPNSFDMISALEAWVESDEAPESILAVHRTNGEVDRSRPLCPFPEVAAYTGTGSTDEVENFECRVP